jgi:Endosomal/lysosomal potassium channel TMEM175
MLREKLIARAPTTNVDFQWRSREVSRLEGLSDTVFGFAITLLIVSLEVPHTSGELLETMRGFIAFAITFALLYSLWYRQFLFFRRYGLEDTRVVILNGALLLFVLFFVFPLKFLAGAVVNRALGLGRTVLLSDGRTVPAIQQSDWPSLFAVYGLGFAAIFAVYAALYHHAYSRRDELGLNRLEVHDTRESVRLFFINAILGVVVGFNGLVLARSHGTRYEDIVAWIFGGAEIVAAGMLLRFRATRGKRRSAIVDTMSPPVEHLPAHAN